MKLAPEQQEYAEIVRNSADGLLSLVNDILDFSKIEAGKMTIEPISFDIHAAVEDVAQLVSVRAFERELEFLVRIDPLTGFGRVYRRGQGAAAPGWQQDEDRLPERREIGDVTDVQVKEPRA